MTNLINDWYLYICILCVVVAVVATCERFTKLPKEEQIENIKHWLVWLCIEAERELQTGTGQAKLKRVYSVVCTTFTWVVKLITFEEFSKYTDDALLEAKTMIVNSPKLAEWIYGDNFKEQVAKIKEQIFNANK